MGEYIVKNKFRFSIVAGHISLVAANPQVAYNRTARRSCSGRVKCSFNREVILNQFPSLKPSNGLRMALKIVTEILIFDKNPFELTSLNAKIMTQL